MRVIASSKYYQLYEDITTRDFYLEIPGDYFRMQTCQLLALRYQLKKINVLEHFDLCNTNIEIISLCDRNQCLILDTLHILDLRNLIEKALTFSSEPSLKIA